MRKCVRCKVEKPESDFNPSKPRTCRDCWKQTQRAWRERQKLKVKDVPDSKRCRGCDQVKPSSEFWRDNARPDGLLYYCRACWAMRNQGYLYGTTPQQIASMMEEQGGRCAICLIDFAHRPHVDHDHECCPTGRTCGGCVRGLLCQNCNHGLGNFKDDPERLQRAIDYLRSVG